MKRIVLFVVIFLNLIAFAGCCQKSSYQTHVDNELLRPYWLSEVKMRPEQWTQGADSWFLTGQPNLTERNARFAPSYKAMAITAVQAPNFNKIHTEGSFQVQILGKQESNSVYILGPQEEIRQISVSIENQTLTIIQDPNSKTKLKNVIVRVEIRQLKQLIYSGCSNVEGRDLNARGLVINSNGTGNIILDGNLNVENVSQDGTGTITLLGVNTKHMDLCVKGDGNVNLSGIVGVSHIQHFGNGTIRIVGADTNGLDIETRGKGLTAIAGYSNLKNLSAEDNSRVYLYWVDSYNTKVTERDKACVGLAGKARNLQIDISDSSIFDGQYLQADSVYAQTARSSHANLHAHRKAFILAQGNSSVYFFGPPRLLSTTKSSNSAVIPMGH